MFELAEMSRAEVRLYNQTAHKHGRHLCPVCLVDYERNADNFREKKSAGKPRYEVLCRTCESAWKSQHATARRKVDPVFRQERNAASAAWFARMSEVERRTYHRNAARKNRRRAQQQKGTTK